MDSSCACSIIAQQVAAFAIAMGSDAAFKAAQVIAERIDSGLGPFRDEEIELMHKMVGDTDRTLLDLSKVS